MAAYLSVTSLLWADSKMFLLKRPRSRFFALKLKLETSCRGKNKSQDCFKLLPWALWLTVVRIRRLSELRCREFLRVWSVSDKETNVYVLQQLLFYTLRHKSFLMGVNWTRLISCSMICFEWRRIIVPSTCSSDLLSSINKGNPCMQAMVRRPLFTERSCQVEIRSGGGRSAIVPEVDAPGEPKEDLGL